MTRTWKNAENRRGRPGGHLPAAKVPYYSPGGEEGARAVIEDVDGNTYIDLLSSAGAINNGHCHPRVVEAIRNRRRT